MKKIISTLFVASLMGLTGCGTADRIANIGKVPKLSPIDNPQLQAGYRPVNMPMPMQEEVHHNANSLWRTGARGFFKDQRARKIGDIVTVLVTIADKAEIDNTSTRSRKNSENIGATGALGTAIDKALLPSGMAAANLAGVTGDNAYTGKGTVGRSEKLTTKVAAVVTQRLPNGNLVIEGRQEVRVNYEIRELVVAGVVRPQDIASNNTIESEKIAEARIGYGGRGQISDVQQPRIGAQFLDAISLF